ncbi:MAG: hypothetical protein JSV80_17245, partial [Acidobacteriota bacterium]
EKLKPGERTKIRMQWENPKAIRDYSYSFKAVPRGGWLPLLRIFDLVEEFELTVKTPEEYKVLGIGGKISDTVEGEVRTTKWRADHPVTFPSIIYGDYFEVESSVQAKKIDGTPIPVTIHVDKVSMSEYQLVPRQLQTLVDEAAQSINLYEAIFQVDYPFDKLDLVNDPVPALYGQAPSSVIYLGSLVFRSMGTLANLGSSRMDATRISRFMRSVVAHEVGHQWWGASVSNANSGNYWFVESLAEYASAYYLEYAYGQKEYDAQVKEWRDTILRAEPLASVQNASIMWSGDKGFGNYQAAVYNKGPYAFHILRETFGDEKFLRFMRMLSRSLAKKQIVTRDIQYIAEVAFGGDMGWFFDQWIRGIGMPQLTYDVSYRATEDGQYVVEGKVQQEIVLGEDDTVLEGRAFRGAVPILIEYRDGGEHEQVLLIEGEETEFRFKVPKEPRKILFNNSGEILFKSMDKASL